MVRRRCALIVSIVASAAMGLSVTVVAASESTPPDFLFELAREYRQAGRLDEAIHELQKLLLIHPSDRRAQRALAELQRVRLQREQAISETLRDTEASQARAREAALERAVQEAQQAAAPPVVTGPATPAAPTAPQEAAEGERAGPPTRRPFGLRPLVTPPGAEGRPEILEVTKRAGFQRLYKEGIGFQPVRGLGFSTRVEIFEEPNPIEDYMLEARLSNFDSLDEVRRSITPLFTRSWAARVTADYEPWPRVTYEFDKRHILHELEARFSVKDRNLETHAFNTLYTLPRMPLVGLVTVNPWYKRVFQASDDDDPTFEDKDEFILNLSLQPTDNFEYFFQYDTFETVKTKSLGESRGRLYKGQVRMRFPRWKLFIIPSFEHSETDYDPSDDELVKRDFFVDWGFDVTKRLRASSKQQFVTLDQSQAGKDPSNPEARAMTTQNTLSYELFKDFDVSFGVDYARGIGLNDYNNVGLRAEMELFKPGIIRAKLGYEWLSYYNISDDLSLLFFKLFLFQ